MITEAQLLNEAADVMENEGWFKLGSSTTYVPGKQLPNTTSYCQCAVTSITVVALRHETLYLVQNLRRRMCDFLGVRRGSLSVWNDAQDGPEPVIQAFRDCAKSLESQV